MKMLSNTSHGYIQCSYDKARVNRTAAVKIFDLRSNAIQHVGCVHTRSNLNFFFNFVVSNEIVLRR